ncbi:MAG: formyltransferase family protein [Halodesulfovibrio sp.]
MKLALLTTDTLHHAFYLRELKKIYPVDLVLAETVSASPPFRVDHPFERERDAFERNLFFSGEQGRLADFGDVHQVDSVNSPQASGMLKEYGPDVVLVFGTGRLRKEILSVCPGRCINLHGGDPERYRGLDSHLWSIYHNDFSGLVTTIHHVNQKLDDGDIILKESLKITPELKLHELRSVNTKSCIDISVSALDMFVRRGRFIHCKQRGCGRYYSFMPMEMKELCVSKFNKYVKEMSQC